jgi:predicted nucleic acid-binding protein
LWAATVAIFNEDFAAQVLNFDGDAADAYAEIAVSRKSAGKPFSQFDAMIVATTRSRGGMLSFYRIRPDRRRFLSNGGEN